MLPQPEDAEQRRVADALSCGLAFVTSANGGTHLSNFRSYVHRIGRLLSTPPGHTLVKRTAMEFLWQPPDPTTRPDLTSRAASTAARAAAFRRRINWTNPTLSLPFSQITPTQTPR
jgi:hypothetical protein